ncbi:hypothetical protein [Ornithinimicrobium kibberense]|uniref:hypothetical protein n=1 Tax=Ornithinimicrobium kibberense TaxID=282060 RepID=UPI003608F1D5
MSLLTRKLFSRRGANGPDTGSGAQPQRGQSGTGPPTGYLPAFFLPATVRLGPLRVRALVFVR